MITTKEAKEFLGIGTTTLSYMVKNGELPSYKIGHKRMFILAELMAWVKERRQFGPNQRAI